MTDQAFDDLHRRHHAAVRQAVTRMLANPADVDDVVQDTFLRAYVALRRRPLDADQLRPWLVTIARNRAVDVLRARRATEPLADRHGGAARDPVAIHAQREQLEATVTAITRLPARQRQALVRHAVDGERYDTIARELRTTTSSAKSLACRARHTVRSAVLAEAA